VSETDTFIDEVSEEVRRDKLFGYLRRYGWIAVLLVLLLVGGAAYNEWRKATQTAQAEALGDSILAIQAQEDAVARAQAYAQIEASGDTLAVIRLLSADGEVQAEMLRAVADDGGVDPLYRDLATLKLAARSDVGLDLSERRASLEPLTKAGAPFRVLAEELLAILEVEAGETEAAMTRLQALLVDDDATGTLRQRATQLIVALGGTPEGS